MSARGCSWEMVLRRSCKYFVEFIFVVFQIEKCALNLVATCLLGAFAFASSVVFY